MFRRLDNTLVRAGLFLPVLLALAGFPPAPTEARQAAAGQPLPAARDVIARYVKAIGGADALAKVNSIRMKGTVEIADQNLSGTVETLHARPAKLITRVTLTGIGTIEQGYDGKIGWVVDRTTPELLSGRRLREIAHDARFDGILRDSSFAKDATLVERGKHDGRSAYKLKVSYASGLELFEYFDTETGLLIGTEGSRELPAPFGVVPTMTILRNYKAFGGLQQPTTTVQRSIGLVQTFTIHSYEYDVVPATAFDVPVAVKALIR